MSEQEGAMGEMDERNPDDLTPEAARGDQDDDPIRIIDSKGVSKTFKRYMAEMTWRDRAEVRFRRALHHLRDAKWWFLHRFHPRHRYHVIHTGLRPGYYDRDTLLEVVMGKLFVDFVEQELGGVVDPENRHDLDREDWARLKELYEFFKNRNVLLEDWSGSSPTREEVSEKLHDLVDLRGLMWT